MKCPKCNKEGCYYTDRGIETVSTKEGKVKRPVRKRAATYIDKEGKGVSSKGGARAHNEAKCNKCKWEGTI